MSEVRLTIRDAEGDWSGTVSGSTADRAIAALSADPFTLAELETACARFEKPNRSRSFFANLSAGFCEEPHDAGLVVIDLVARLVVVDSTYSSPGPTGEVCYHDGQCATDKSLRYHLAEDWLFLGDRFLWHATADRRRRERAANPVFDARRVFYGSPLLEFIAREVFAAHTRHRTITAEAQDSIKEIHAAWLLTRRDDLENACPRDVALARHQYISWDLQDQADRWSLLGECPPGLDESSVAYRHGGFGTHELVLYYDLVRELLWSCWEQLAHLNETQPAAGRPETFLVGDFLTSEIPRLESIRDNWLETPDPEFHGRTPRSIIDRERARVPEGMSGHHAIVDPDCPCCQMLADMPGPVFWHLDGCNMDDNFAFDIDHRTREEWEDEQRKWEEHHRRGDAEHAERQRLGVTNDSGFGVEDEQSVWSSSFSGEDAADLPLGMRLFGIGCRLAELIADLRGDQSSSPQGQQLIDRLNRDFGNLRELLQNSEPSLAASLIDPVIDRFTESLATVASTRPDLAVKCESLTNSLARFLEPRSSDSTWDSDDSDLPL
ncbi:MAG: hypothetical protein KF777_18330 [Planctomycetaceae bacterium]|nr:hypothetical protein [Planctomycetaceae bacterium]